jgi:hypothetical protein
MHSKPITPVPPSCEGEALEWPPVSSTGGGLTWNWRRHIFYLLSIIVHVAAVAALMTSWTRSEPKAAQTAVVEPPKAEAPQVVRLAIDLAPVKTCDMKIDSLVREIPQKKVARNPFAPFGMKK